MEGATRGRGGGVPCCPDLPLLPLTRHSKVATHTFVAANVGCSMRLNSFSVENFRSITAARKVPMRQITVLIGPNNEGKSNILRALSLAMNALGKLRIALRRNASGSIVREGYSMKSRHFDYNWEEDFPVSRQRSKGKYKSTKITLEFELSPEEQVEFKEKTGSRVNGLLPIQLEFGETSFDFQIVKQGPGSVALNKAKNRVADFVSKKLSFDYIPPIRTSQSASKVVNNIVSSALISIYEDDQFTEAMDRIEELQRPVLDELSESIKETVSEFLPAVKSVELRLEKEDRYRALSRAVKVYVDDGNLTSLSRKGEGVQSLVALALMRQAGSHFRRGLSSVVAIEEPESHLHPNAVHELRDIIIETARESQVVLSTHSPLFANAGKGAQLVIVKDSRAEPAKSIADVRDCLGVRLSDNLMSSRLMAIVEGPEDQKILESILPELNPALANPLRKRDLVLDVLGGAGSLSSRVAMHKSSVSLFHALLDDDDEGRRAVDKALKNSLMTQADYTLTKIPGFKESEFEDYYDMTKLSQAFLERYGVDPCVTPPTAKGKKWSDAMKARFAAHGKIWDDQVKADVKSFAAERAAQLGVESLVSNRISTLKSFADRLASLID